MGKHICIIGGSGFVGRVLTRRAIDEGYQVTVACRHPERSREILAMGARLVRANITDGKGVQEAVQGADCVINLVGLLFEKGASNFEAAHVKGAEHVLAVCAQTGVKQYIHMSALGAGKVPASAYARTKAEAENLVRKSAGLCWSIFRPSIIYGEGDNFFNQFKKMSALLPVLPVIEGKTRFQPVWVEDVARAMLAVVGDKDACGKTYELGGPKAYSFRHLLEILMGELDRSRLLLPVPRFAAKLIAGFAQFLPVPPLTPDQLVLLQQDNVLEGKAFPKKFGQAAELEKVLPTYIRGNQPERLQYRLDHCRKYYRKG